MNFQLDWPGIGVILVVLLHAYNTIKGATKISLSLEQIKQSLDRFDEEFRKRDATILAAFKKIDGLTERVIRIEAKYNLHTRDEND